MSTTARVVLDPTEFMPLRVQLSLEELGIRIMDEDWGDAAHELFLVRQWRGEIPADRHPPNRTVTLKLKAQSEGVVALAEAAYKLQQKVGIMQDEGGFVRRDMDIEGGFLVSVAAPVLTAELGGLHGWLMAHRAIAPEITLVLTIGPTFYGVNEKEEVETEETVNREHIFTIPKVRGSAPGLWRSKIKNTNVSAPFRTIVEAIESRDYPGAATATTTAHLAYEAEKLTLLGGAEKSALTGSSTEAVKFNPTNSWLAFLGSEIAGVGNMTHLGPRKIMARVFMEEPTTMQFRLEYRMVGAPYWTQGAIIEPEIVASGFTLLDLGECRVERMPLGNLGWEFKITAKTTGVAGATPVYIDKVYPLPLEQIITATAPMAITSPTAFKVLDAFNQTPGENLTGKAAEKGGVYAVLTNSDADDFKLSEGGTIKRETISDTGTLL